MAGGTYHVWGRGNNKQVLFIDDEDRRLYLKILADVMEEFRWTCLAYSLMGNHLHLVVRTELANLSHGIQAGHNAYARESNVRHGRINHLFGRRFGSSLLDTEQKMQRLVAYVVKNPVAAGLCATAEEWPWGSHPAVLDGTAPVWLDVGRLGDLFGGLDRYAAIVASSADLG